MDEVCREHPGHETHIRRRLERLAAIGLLAEPGKAQDQAFPSRLGEFTLQRRLGGGGMGVVYQARQESLGRTVALKVIRPEMLFFSGARARFRREVDIVSRLQHPGIVPIFTVGEEGGVPYFAMERIEGCSLAEALQDLQGREPGQLTGQDLALAVARRAGQEPRVAAVSAASLYRGSWTATCVRIAHSVAEALEHAHGRGILHRDVKPSNILLTLDGRVLLTDFGLGAAEGAAELTQTSSQLGSLLYMSPEQIRGEPGFHHDARCDVYSLGATFYEALTLRPAHADDSSESIRQRIREGRPPAVRTLNRAVPRDIATICAKAMETDLARRYQSSADLARDLENFEAKRPVEARPAGSLLRAHRWSQRHPAISLSLLLAMFALVGFTLWQRVESEHTLGVHLLGGSRAQLDSDPTLALLLAIEAAQRRPGLDANNLLLEVFDKLHERRTLLAPEGAWDADYAAISPDGHTLAVFYNGAKSTICIWDRVSGTIIRTLDLGGECNRAVFSPDGSRLYSATTGPDLWTVWDTATWTLLEHREVEGSIVAIDERGECYAVERVAVGPPSSCFTEIRSASDDRTLSTLEGHSEILDRAEYSDDGSRIAIVSRGSAPLYVAIHDAFTGRLLQKISKKK